MLSLSLRQRLSRLSLRAPHRIQGQGFVGGYRSRRRGHSLEFSQHRDYSPGDDLRHLDWSAFARSERLVVKEFEAELERTVLIALDLSASMQGPKSSLGLQCAAALAWVGLNGQDRVGLAILGGNYHPPLRGRSQWGRLRDWLEAQPQDLGGAVRLPLGPPQSQDLAKGRAELGSSLRRLVQRLPRSSLVLVVSDWLEEDWAAGLGFAHHCKHSLAALQLLDTLDCEPPWLGPVQLQDAESGHTLQLNLESKPLEHYRQALESHCQELSQHCRRLGFGYHRFEVERGLESLLLSDLVAQGWLQ